MYDLIYYGAPSWDAIPFFVVAEFTGTFLFLNLIVSLVLYRLKKNLEEEEVQERLEFLKDIENGIEKKRNSGEVQLKDIADISQIRPKIVNKNANNNVFQPNDDSSVLVFALSNARLNHKPRAKTVVDPSKIKLEKLKAFMLKSAHVVEGQKKENLVHSSLYMYVKNKKNKIRFVSEIFEKKKKKIFSCQSNSCEIARFTSEQALSISFNCFVGCHICHSWSGNR